MTDRRVLRRHGSLFVGIALALCAGSASAADPVKPFKLKILPAKVTGVSASPALAVSEADGTATINFTVTGTGVGACKARVLAVTGNVYAETLADISAESGFPTTVPLKLPRPGVYQVVAADRSVFATDCEGKGSTTVIVKAHPDFPCSLYPGFKKAGTFGNMWGCVPNVPPAKVTPSLFVCEDGATFHNYSGYIFGCFAPGFLPGN